MNDYPLVKDIRKVNGAGPWQTKSGGTLEVLFGIPLDVLNEKYFSYKFDGINSSSKDIRGLRAYTVSDIKNGIIGANEWHKARSELVFVLNGKIRWDSEDVDGGKHSVILENGSGIWTPPYILHTYTAMEDNAIILVIANTLFDADDASTQDTYSADIFRTLQAKQ